MESQKGTEVTATPGRTRPFVVRRRWTIILSALLFALLAGAVGGDVQSQLKSGGFETSDAESTRAAAKLEHEFQAGEPDVVLLVSARHGGVDDPDIRAQGESLTRQVGQESGVVRAGGYWQADSSASLRSEDRKQALVLVQLRGSEDERLRTAGLLREKYDKENSPASLDVAVGGQATAFEQMNHVIEEDTTAARALAFPVTAVLLIVIFGSVVAGLLPVLIAGIAVAGTFLCLTLIGSVTNVSIFALSFTTAIGLGLSIDYSLLVVSRFREELDEGHEVPLAVARTVRTAGRTIFFSAATVASSLVALLIFDQYFLRSFAYAGIVVVALAAVGATVILPAVLAVIGRNVNRWRVRERRPATGENGRWHRLALAVMRRPIPIATAAITLLVLLGLPFFRVELGFPDDRQLPQGVSSRDVGETIRADFKGAEASPLTVVTSGIGDPGDHSAAIADYAAELSALGGVARVDALTGSYVDGASVGRPSDTAQRFAGTDGTYVHVIPAVEPVSPKGEQLAKEVRQIKAPFDTLVGGQSAELVDGKAGLMDRLPWALGIIALTTFVVLFISFGSLLMPFKAIVLNLLSLTTTFGVLVWCFQEGNLAGTLDFSATGTLVITMPVLIFVVAFGLSMDYEVFLLSRVKEEYERTGDNVLSVATGLERTGRVVTAAAVLIAVVFIAFATGRVTSTKMFGIGMALAVLVDAFIIRTLLVPAFMRLAGRANWWAPKPLRRLHAVVGFTEKSEPVPSRPDSAASPDRLASSGRCPPNR